MTVIPATDSATHAAIEIPGLGKITVPIGLFM